MGNAIAVVLGEVGHALAFREILPEQAVGVFVSAALPGMVRGGEVEAGTGRAFEGCVAMELGAVVDGDGTDGAALMPDQLGGPAVHLGGCASPQLPEQEVASFSFDQAQHTGPRLAGSEHRVRLPMPNLRAFLHYSGACGDGALPRQPPAAVVAAVTFGVCSRRHAV